MRNWQHISIRNKLMLIIMLISTVVVLITTSAITMLGYYSMKQNMLDDLEFTAASVGTRNSAALLFGDVERAEENLRFFSNNTAVVRACLYSTDGELFARYIRSSDVEECEHPTQQHIGFHNEHLLVFQDIVRMGDKIGQIVIESDLQQLHAFIRQQIIIAFGVIISVLFISYLMSMWLQRTISRPVLALSETAYKVSQDRDYSVRAPQYGKPSASSRNELLVLIDSFNTMLSEIESRDSTLRQKNEELEKAKDLAIAGNRAKSQFIANISHELRTPLNAIIGFSSILRDELFGPLGSAKYNEYATDIHDAGVHLLDIINDILDLSKAEAGKLTLAFEEVHVPKSIKKCMQIISNRAQEGEVVLVSNVPDNLPPLHADRLRFIQIILNLLSNAVKFTQPGGRVTVSAHIGEDGFFVVAVEDTGIGMETEDIQKALQSFGQVDSGLNRKYEGTGLGLPLTKKLVELHGGTMDIVSMPGKGTAVTLVFPPEGKQRKKPVLLAAASSG